MKICFICHANICRSFMAQEILKKFIIDDNRNDIKVISRGTYVLSQFLVPQKIKDFLKKNNIEYTEHIPTQYSKEDLASSDLIFVMTKDQLKLLNDNYAQFSDKTYLFLEYCLDINKDMLDPIDKKGTAFDTIANDIKKAILLLYNKIKL